MPETIFGLTELAEAPSFLDWFPMTDASDTAQSANGSTRRNKGQYLLGSQVNAQTGTTYTYLTTDFRKLVTHTNASPVAGTLPQAGVNFPAGWWMMVQNRGAGALTITPTTSTIDGAASLVLNQNEGAIVVSDGTNYFTLRGKATGAAGVGDVVGPSSATDNALARFDTTTGKLIQNSATELHDDGSVVMPEMAAPATPAAGKVAIYPKTDGKLYIKDDAGTETDLTATGTGAETGANSDITSMDGLTGALENPTQIIFPEGAAPSTPGANKVTLYAKADGLLYSKDDAGTETVVTGGGGGGGSPGGSDGDIQYRVDASTFGGSPLKRTDANTLDQYNSTTNQNLSVYGRRTSATDYQRIRIGWTSGAAEIFSEAQTQSVSNLVLKVGSGTSLNMGTASLVPSANITFVLGSSSNYFNEIYNNTWITRAGGVLRFVSGCRLAGPAQGLLRIQDDSGNTGSGTIAFESRAYSIGADTNDFNGIVPAYFHRWTATGASRNLTGLTYSSSTKSDGQIHLMVNVGSNNLVIKHEDAGSTAANRFNCSTGADITLAPNEAADIIYDGTLARWRVFKR